MLAHALRLGRFLGLVLLTTTLSLILISTLVAGGRKHVGKETGDGNLRYPDTVIALIKGGERFRDPDYFKLMASDGIRSADPKAVSERMSAASQAGENYKALYLARLFTDLRPDLPAGWSNRAKVAAALGIRDEAVAAQAHAENLSLTEKVPLGVLPGQGLAVRPKDLSDWAAAIALLSDGMAAKQGPNALVSLRDDVSGVELTTVQQELASMPDEDEEDREEIIKSGPYTSAKPLRLDDVASNLFSLQAPQPMVERSGQKMGAGDALAMIALGATSGMAASRGDVATATQTSEALGQIEGARSAVASVYSGGSFKGVTFKDGNIETANYQPKASGQYHAIGWPLPVLWASPGSTTSSFHGQISSHDTTFGHKVLLIVHRPEDLAKPKARSKYAHVKDPELYFPKLAKLCEYRTCSTTLTLMELMLNDGDIAAFGGPSSQRIIHFAPLVLLRRPRFEQAYQRGSLTFQIENSDKGLVGFDEKGVAYSTYPSPSQWLVPIGPSR